MKRLLIILSLFISSFGYSQCVGTQTVTMTPAGPYQPGDVVVVEYTLWSFTQLNINWIIAFQINLGNGWCGLQPLQAPNNTGTQSGYWLWDIQNTYPSGLNFGPGWRFVNTGWQSNWGSSGTGPWTMRFQLTVCQTCTPDNLSVSMNVFGDCLTGGWSNGSCCLDPAYSINNGVVQIITPITSPISHY
ncbi:MAG: hypothetical protein H8E55_46820 [Pelagibacterales bacterium]|nr:hypothetical protein [Pelagibacterales bacterium]